MLYILLLIIIYISFISLGLPDSLLGSAWPSMYSGIGVPISYAGIIAAITAGFTILSSLLSARLIKKLGTGTVTMISVFMTAGALFGFSVSHNFVVLCFLSIPLGLGAGCVDTALNNYVALYYKARHMSWLHCFWGVGATIGPIIMSYWLIHGRWNLGYRTISFFQIVLAFILLISLPLWKKAGGRQVNGIKVEEEHKVLSFMQCIRMPRVKSALGAFFFYCAIEVTVGLWGSSFLVEAKGIDEKTAAGWIALYYFGITFGRFLSGFITIKLNQKQTIHLGEAIMLVGIVLLVIPGIKVLLLPGLFMIGLGCAPIFPCLIHETPTNFGAQNSQSIIGMQMAFSYVGTTMMPPIFGFLASRFGYGIFQLFLGIMFLLMLVVIEMLHKGIDYKVESNI
jgi:fucose permease